MSKSIKPASNHCAAICILLPLLLVLLQVAHVYAPCCAFFSCRCCVFPTEFSFPPVFSDIPSLGTFGVENVKVGSFVIKASSL